MVVCNEATEKYLSHWSVAENCFRILPAFVKTGMFLLVV